MRYLSLFSGIEAASVAWLPLGWECVAVAEIEKFPSAVLAHHYPSVPNLGDITKITKEQIGALGRIDLVVGGFPCQDLSIAGNRKGLRDEHGNHTRSGLFFDAMRVVRWANPRYLLLENVPGIYSSNKGRDFASVVGEILGIEFAVPTDGWRNTGVAASDRGLFEWATLDAQWFGVPQRRRRMFALADFGDWTSRPPILFESHSLQGHSAPSRETRKVTAGAVVARAGRNGGASNQDVYGGNLIAFGGNNTSGPIDVSTAVNACGSASGRMDFESETFVTNSYAIPINTQVAMRHRALGERTGLGVGDVNDPAFTLQAGHSHAVAFSLQHAKIGRKDSAGPQGKGWQQDVSFTLDSRPCADAVAFDLAQITSKTNRSRAESGLPAGTLSKNSDMHVAASMQVRRLTPRECARLQGFPDDYLDIIHNGKPAADGPKYKALGNSFAVPVVRWIGERIMAVEKTKEKAA